jgi:hypothetical protein
VGQGVEDHFDDVLIGEGVINMLPLAAANNQVFTAQDAEPLRDRRKLFLGGGGNFSNARLTLTQEREDSQAGHISDGPENAGGPVERDFIDDRFADRPVRVVGSSASRPRRLSLGRASGFGCCLQHLNNSATVVA